MTGGFPNPATFPTDVLGEIAARLLRDDPGVALQYTPVRGAPERPRVPRRPPGAAAGPAPGAGELIVTSGGMECIALTCQALLDPGDDDRGRGADLPRRADGVRAAAEADVHGIAMDDDGLVVDALAERARGRAAPEVPLRHPGVPEPDRPHAAARAPGGARRAVPPPRRADLRGRRLPRAGLRRRARCRRCGRSRPTSSSRPARSRRSSSRACGSAGPPARPTVVAQLAAAKQNTDQCAGALGQRLVEEYGRAGHFERELPRRPRALRVALARARRRAARATCPRACTWTEPTGGFLTWLDAPAALDAIALRDAAHRGRRRLRARARRSTPPTPAPTSCGSPSATSARPSSPRRAGGWRRSSAPPSGTALAVEPGVVRPEAERLRCRRPVPRVPTPASVSRGRAPRGTSWEEVPCRRAGEGSPRPRPPSH